MTRPAIVERPTNVGAIIVLSAEKCERCGMEFYRAPNGAILTTGLNGLPPASCVQCVRRLPDYKVLWLTMSKQWGSMSATVLIPLFGDKGGRKRHLQTLEVQWKSPNTPDFSRNDNAPKSFHAYRSYSAAETTYLVETRGRRKRLRHAAGKGGSRPECIRTQQPTMNRMRRYM